MDLRRPGDERKRPLEGSERYIDGVDKLFDYPVDGLSPAEAESVKALEADFEHLARHVLVMLAPCSDRNHVLRGLREAYLVSCDSIRLRGAV